MTSGLTTDHKERNRILAQFSVSSFFIAEIMRCWLHGDKLSWWRTCFKLVAYMLQLLGSNNVKFNLLGDKIKGMLRID